MTDFPKQYKHSEREAFWQQQWEAKGVYHWRGDKSRADTYVIDTPPPTVSGLLHMGHIYSYTHTDFMARYMRMKGKDVFYPMGFDDNGLPTERLVEKAKKIRAKDVSRETFIEMCEDISAEARKEFRALFTATALSVDWNLEYHTISEHARRISQASFVDLFEKGQVYRSLEPMLWDPVDQTAIAQAEVEDKELEGVFCDIRFAVKDSEDTFVIGTTRPELLPACVAIFYHPEDARYQHLAGKQAITPLFGVEVPILADETVEPEKGTGIMMCCTFGDEADIDKWRRHALPLRVVLNQYGKIDFPKNIDGDLSAFGGKALNQNLTELNGLSAKNARAKMMELLEEAGLLEAKKPITHAVKCAERSGAPLEILPTHQWFVKTLEHKDALKALSKSANWNPAWMEKRMEQWIDGLNWDWCISRQRYYGVPFPVWYVREVRQTKNELVPVDSQFTVLADADELPVNPLDKDTTISKFTNMGYSYTNEWYQNNIGKEILLFNKDGKTFSVEPDIDVMDTWATSAISPQINAGAVSANHTEDTTRFEQLFPADVRPQAHEIIRTWGFYTLLKGYLHNNSLPWHNLMISGWCLAADKTKMSKSKGNVITPTSLLQEKGTDAVRYWASTAKLGTDTAFSEDLLKIGNKLVNKLWNASKFASLQLVHMKQPSATAKEAIEQGIITEALDKWMISRIHHGIVQCDKTFAEYDYSAARHVVEQIFWNDFCDNYLELVKSRAYGNMGEAAQQSACHTIWHSLNALLKLFAPFVPHITEEIFSIVYAEEFAATGSIHARGMFPDVAAYPKDAEAEQRGIATVALLELVRKAKSEKGVSIKYPIEQAYFSGISAEWIEAVADDLQAAGNIRNIVDNKIFGNNTMHLFDDASKLAVSLIFAAQADVA